MDAKMKALADAPLANPIGIYLPEGKRPAPRARKAECDDIGCPKVSSKELRERKQKALAARTEALFDYYAKTELTAERVAEHMGLYRNEQTGFDDKGKPIMVRVLDVKRADDHLAWRRKQAA